jgi:hypothetical protein
MSSILSLGTVNGWAQTADAGCTVEREQATCNWTAFRKVLDGAHTVKVDYRERDKATGAQLKELTQKLGKTLASGDEKPDLSFTVIPAVGSGIDVSSADKEILELHVYAGDNSQEKLIWVETYIGQKDRPLPANVHATISQFLSRLKKS